MWTLQFEKFKMAGTWPINEMDLMVHVYLRILTSFVVLKWNCCGVGYTITRPILDSSVTLLYYALGDYNFANIFHSETFKFVDWYFPLFYLLVFIILSYLFDSNFEVHLAS